MARSGQSGESAAGTTRGAARRPARPPVDQSGRALGPRARQTRQRLLEATAELMRERSVREISVVEIARKVGTSPATFYQYFKDVPEATLCLAEQAAGEMPALVEIIDRAWRGREGLATARQLVDAFIRHWDEHHAVLRLRNLAAEEGDRRFQRARRTALAPVLEHLAARVAEFQAEGRVSKELHPYAAAAALASILERLAAYHTELEVFGATREQLVETCARILVQTVTGRAPR
ncbi:MAG: TetR family transcriptional regulator [Myxococcota bacterium]